MSRLAVTPDKERPTVRGTEGTEQMPSITVREKGSRPSVSPTHTTPTKDAAPASDFVTPEKKLAHSGLEPIKSIHRRSKEKGRTRRRLAQLFKGKRVAILTLNDKDGPDDVAGDASWRERSILDALQEFRLQKHVDDFLICDEVVCVKDQSKGIVKLQVTVKEIAPNP